MAETKKLIMPKIETDIQPWQSWLARAFELVKIVIILTMVGYLAHVFIITLFVVEGASMEPNFFDKEYILVDKITYNFIEPKRGDVVIFSYPGEPGKKFIKRIIGLPGDTIEIKNEKLYLYNKQHAGILSESYLPPDLPTPTETDESSLRKKVTSEEYFVLGDNRFNSSDSRIWGMLPREDIIGKALIVIWPISDFGMIEPVKY